jgi:hypothetical protein
VTADINVRYPDPKRLRWDRPKYEADALVSLPSLIMVPVFSYLGLMCIYDGAIELPLGDSREGLWVF